MKKRTAGINNWSIKNSIEMYGIENWGGGFFNINKDGEVTVSLRRGDSLEPVSLYQIVKGLEERGITMPILMHFPDLIFTRIDRINRSFNKAMKECGYTGFYRGAYPIKVNQQQHVVEEMVRYGVRYNYGLEAGSKPELMIAIASIKSKEPLIICNGYKDEEFIDLALYGTKLGLNIFLVIERPNEANTIISRARKIGVKPNIGIRAKLSSSVGGKWAESAGDHSVFGLTASQIISVIDLLREEQMMECLRFLHYHMGSQIPDIRDIREAAGEAARIYISMASEGAPMEYLDIGGGLAVDYDGSRTIFESSKNYSMEEYCRTVIDLLKEAFDDASVKHPNIVSESGRAVTAYSSMLVFNILDVNSLIPENGPPDVPENSHENIFNLKEILDIMNIKNIQEHYHDAIFYRDELRKLFQLGKVTLRERAIAEELFWGVIKKISVLAEGLKYVPEEMKMLESVMADIYYGNFSLFQSLPDCWAIDQLFPVMPLHKLAEQPTNHAIIADTTCDCDGKIDKFIGLYDIKRSIMLHPLKKDEEYLLGVFLVGAYQETLGDLHNLFGDTHVIGIVLDEDGEIELTREISGDSVSDVLSYVEYDPQSLLEQIRTLAELGVKEKRVTAKQRKEIMSAFEEGMRGYTYFEL
ncbi:MAG: biosynthetic arginine decarboxylase [Spirochaetaceae bacterium]|nr:biosynthetic arginine decarboxylase [Spirochaetaceae bacterium]